MKYFKLKQTSPAPNAGFKASLSAWRRVGIASLVAASLFANSAFMQHAEAARTQDPVALLNFELATNNALVGGVPVTLATATSAQLNAALKAAIAENIQFRDPGDPAAPAPVTFIQAILNSGISDKNKIAFTPSLIKTAVSAIQYSGLHYDAGNIQNMLDQISIPLAQVIATNYTTITANGGLNKVVGSTVVIGADLDHSSVNYNYTPVLAAVSAKLSLIITETLKGIPLFDSETAAGIAANTASSIVNELATGTITATLRRTDLPTLGTNAKGKVVVVTKPTSINTGSVDLHLESNQIAQLAAAAVKAVPVAYQSAAAAKVSQSLFANLGSLSQIPGDTAEAKRITLAVSLLKYVPVAYLSQVTDVLVAASTDTIATSRTIFVGNPAAAAVTALAKSNIANASNKTDTFAGLVATTSANTAIDAKITDAIRGAITAGAIAASPANATAFTETAIANLASTAKAQSLRDIQAAKQSEKNAAQIADDTNPTAATAKALTAAVKALATATTNANTAAAAISKNAQAVLKLTIAQLAPLNPTAAEAAFNAFIANRSYLGSDLVTGASTTPTAIAAAQLALAKSALTASSAGSKSTSVNAASIAALVKNFSVLKPTDSSIEKWTTTLASLIPSDPAGIRAVVKGIVDDPANNSATANLTDFANKIAGSAAQTPYNAKALPSPTLRAALASGVVNVLPLDSNYATKVGTIATSIQGTITVTGRAANTQMTTLANTLIGGIQWSNEAYGNSALSTVVSTLGHTLQAVVINHNRDETVISPFVAAIAKLLPADHQDQLGSIAQAAIGSFQTTPGILQINDVVKKIVLATPTSNGLTGLVESTFPTTTLNDQIAYIRDVTGASAVAATPIGKAIGTQVMGLNLDYTALFTTAVSSSMTTAAKSALTASKYVAQIAGGLALADSAHAEAIATAASTTRSATSVAASVAAALRTNEIPFGTSTYVTLATNASDTIKAKAGTTLGGVAGAILANVPEITEDVIQALLPKSTAFTGAKTDLARITDLGNFAGKTISLLTGQDSAISTVITSTTVGTVLWTSGTSGATTSTLDLATLVSGSSVVTYTAKTSNAAGAAASLFITKILEIKTSDLLTVGDTTAAKLANFVAAVITGGGTKTADIVKGSAIYGADGSAAANVTAFATELAAMPLLNVAKYNTIKAAMGTGLAKALVSSDFGLSQETLTTAIKNVTSALVGSITDLDAKAGTWQTAKIALAVAIAKETPNAQDGANYIYWITDLVAANLDSEGTDLINRAKLVKGMIPLVKASAVANDQIASIVIAGLNGVNSSVAVADLATYLATAITAKATAAYDIFGAAVAYLSEVNGNDLLTAVKNKVASRLWNQLEKAYTYATTYQDNFSQGEVNTPETNVHNG